MFSRVIHSRFTWIDRCRPGFFTGLKNLDLAEKRHSVLVGNQQVFVPQQFLGVIAKWNEYFHTCSIVAQDVQTVNQSWQTRAG